MKFIDINTEYKIFKKDIDYSLKKVINNSNFILGPEVRKLEDKLKIFTGSKFKKKYNKKNKGDSCCFIIWAMP